MAEAPLTGHLNSQMPQPMHSPGMTVGRFTQSRPPWAFATYRPLSSSMAFRGVGHISWQTMHGVPCAHGRQRSLSMTATRASGVVQRQASMTTPMAVREAK